MGIFRLERGLVVQIGERRFAFHRQIGDKQIQLENVMTGELRSMRITDFLNRMNSGQYAVSHQTADGVVVAMPSARDRAGHEVLGLKLTAAQNAQWQLRCVYVQGIYKRGVTRGQRSRMNRTGDRGGCLVKVKQVPPPVVQVVDSSSLRLRLAGCHRSIPIDAGD